MISITDNAKEKINLLLLEENNPKIFLRTFVQGGGCSGLSYGFTFDEEKNDDDFEFPIGEFKLLIDTMSMQYLEGSRSSIKNPNAQTSCGCGNSFSV